MLGCQKYGYAQKNLGFYNYYLRYLIYAKYKGGFKMAKIKEVAVVPYKQHAYCECGEELEYTNKTLTSNLQIYPHRCPKCNKEYNLNCAYPTLIWKEKKK